MLHPRSYLAIEDRGRPVRDANSSCVSLSLSRTLRTSIAVGFVTITNNIQTGKVIVKNIMESLADLKELRENAEVNQETAAEWIGVVRSTYTRKEKGDLPTAFAEYALVKLKLELILESKKEVMPPCGILDSERVEDICRNVGVIYKSGSQPAINSLVCHIETLVSMLVGRSQKSSNIPAENYFQIVLDRNLCRV